MTSNLDRNLWNRSVCFCGVDEAGRGALAGPVVAAAVVMPVGSEIAGVDDSKKLTPRCRVELARVIRGRARSWAVAAASPALIDARNILEATRAAMLRAVAKLTVRPRLMLVDGPPVPGAPLACRGVIGGDRLSYSIACASILAKVHRDRLMTRLGRVHPGYGFPRHKGYGTSAHLIALAALGPSAVHRRTFGPVAARAG
ncbi:MAG: ribonuclease HII [bacterium]